MKALRIERTDGVVQEIYGVQEWAWQQDKGLLYYRKGGWLKHEKVKNVKEIK